MAMAVRVDTLGVDVAKDWLDIFDGESAIRIGNDTESIKAFFKQLTTTYRIAIEPTSTYHEGFIYQALARDHVVYLVNPFKLSRYRDAVGVRAKTDTADAKLLFRYLESEASRLKPYTPPPAAVRRLMRLLRVRGKLTQSKVTITQSLSGLREMAASRKSLIRRIDDVLEMIDRRMLDCLRKAGYSADYERCLSIPAVGPLNAAVLTTLYNRGAPG